MSVGTFHFLFSADLWISWSWWVIVLSLTGKARWRPTGKNFFSASAFLRFAYLHIPSELNYALWRYISVVTALDFTWHTAEDIAATCVNSWKLRLHINITYAVKEGHLSTLCNTLGVKVQVNDAEIFTTCSILLILLSGCMFHVTYAPLRISSAYTECNRRNVP
jgi:hypothetical protein